MYEKNSIFTNSKKSLICGQLRIFKDFKTKKGLSHVKNNDFYAVCSNVRKHAAFNISSSIDVMCFKIKHKLTNSKRDTLFGWGDSQGKMVAASRPPKKL
jgi:hypothetical protein